MFAFETILLKIKTRFILLLALFSLPSISANTDCGGMPFRCVNSTFFKICVDFGNNISSTVDDFMIPCPPGTECRLTNHFECEATPALLEKTTVTEKVTIAREEANITKYKDERSVVTPKWEESSVKPQEVELSEKYLNTDNHVTLLDESLSTTNALFDVMTELTTESVFVTIPDKIPFETTTVKNIGVTKRSTMKETLGDFLNPVEVTAAYPGINIEHPFATEPEIIPTSEVITTTFSENSKVISTTEQYGVGDFSQVGDAETITTDYKVSKPNDNFVEATTLYDWGINKFFYSTPAPISEKSFYVTLAKTDQTEEPTNPTSPQNILETAVQNVGIEFAFTTEANDAYKTTQSLTTTDTITHAVPIVNTGVINNKNLDFLVPGNIFENSLATIESNTVVTFDTLSTTPAEYATDSLLNSDYSKVTSNILEASTEFPKDIQNPNEINFKETSSNAFENKPEQESIIQTTTTDAKFSNANEKIVKATTLYATGLNYLVYSTPAPISEKSYFEILTKTDQTEGPSNPISPLNILETTVQNIGTELNDAYETTLSLTQTDAITHDINMINTGFLNNRNSDFTTQGIIFESTPATTESITVVMFDALAKNPDDYATDYISQVTSNIFELSTEIPKDTTKADGINFKEILSDAFENKPGEKPITQHLGPKSLTDSIMASIIPGNKKITEADSTIQNGNIPTITESITQVQENTKTIFNLENNLTQQADGNSAPTTRIHDLNKEDNRTVVSAKDTPVESATKIPTESDKLQSTTEVNGDNIPTVANKYSWKEQQNPTNIEQTPRQIDNVAITAKDQTSFNKMDSASNQQDSKLEINGISPFRISNEDPSDIKTNKQNIEETKVHQFHLGSSQLTPDKIGKPEIQQTNTAALTHVGSVPQKASKIQNTQQTAKTDDTEMHQINEDTAKMTPTPSYLNQLYTATVVASTVATIRQVPTPITEGDVNKPTAPVQGMITESLSQTPSDVTDIIKLLEYVNGATLDQTKHLSGQGNVLGNHYSNIKQDGAFNAGPNVFSQTSPSFVTSPWTETNIAVDESLLIEVTTASPLEKALYTFSIPATNNADTTTPQLTKGMIEPTDVTAPATVTITGNVNPRIAASAHGIVPENAINTGATPGLYLSSSAENTVKPPATSSSVQVTHGEVRSETASVKASDAPMEKQNNDVQVADATQTIHLISKPTGTEDKAPLLSQPPVIRKEETIVKSSSNINYKFPTVSTNADLNQRISKANNVASLETAGVTGADMIHSSNDLSTKAAVGKIQTPNVRDVTVTDDSYMSTQPANVIPNPDPPTSYQTSPSAVVQEVKAADQSKDAVQNPSDKEEVNQEKVNELKIIKTINSVYNGKRLDNAKAESTAVLDTHNNSQVPKISPKIITSESPATQLVIDTTLMSTTVVESGNNFVHFNAGTGKGHTKSPPTIAATIGIPTTSSLLPLSTTERVQVVTPTVVKDEVVHQNKAVARESTNGGNANQKVNKYTVKAPAVTTASTPADQRTSASIGLNCSDLPRGRYSDEDDCRKFHICIDQQDPIVGYCPNNTVFSEIKKQCTKNLSHCVRGNEFQCVSSGRYSDYLLKNIYYICVKTHHNFYRFKFQCQTGFYLNKTLVRCMPNSEGSVESVSSDDISNKDSDRRRSTSNATSTSTTTEIILRKTKKPKESKSSTTERSRRRKNKDECEEVGKYPHPEDCRKYYVCYKASKSQLKQRRKKCDSDEVFHKDKRKCVDAESYECDL